MITQLRLIHVLACIAFLGLPVWAAQVQIPATTVSMEPPPGFTIAEGYAGFHRPTDGSSILVSEMPPEAHQEVSTLFAETDQAAASWTAQGVTITARRVVIVDGAVTPLLVGSQPLPALGADFQVGKYIALLGGGRNPTVLVTFNFMDDLGVVGDAVVEAALESVRLTNPPTLEEKLAALTYSFEPVEPFRVFDVISGSAAVLSTRPEPDPTGLLPVVVIAPSLSPVGVDSRELAESMLLAVDTFEAAEIVATETVAFAGGEGYLSEAVDGNRTGIQFIRFTAGGAYIRLLALGEKNQLEAVVPSVSAIANSVAYRSPPR